MEDYDKIKKVLAIDFMHFLDENRPEGKMCLSNGECADIEKAFNEQDWSKLARYLDKYLVNGGSSEKPVPADLEEAAEEYRKVHTDEVMVSDGYHNDHTKEVFDVTPGEAFIAGAKWQKKQMLNEAVEGIAVINANAKEDGFGYVRSDYMPDDVLRGLGNFKLIIVKED